MSNFFEQELRKLCGDGQVIHDPIFVGRACVGGLDGDRQVRAEFVTIGHADHYEALRLTLLDSSQGVIDKLTLRFKELWGKKGIPDNPYLRNGVNPHIWVNGEQTDWYAYHPTRSDYQKLRQAAGRYLDAFRGQPRTPEPEHRLVYICAPLRGDVEKNITFAREKAKAVFQAGQLPICPHLMFPPVADPADPVQDQAAREMGLQLLALCQQVNVYGPRQTEGMREEIRQANALGIPVVNGDRPLKREASKGRSRGKSKEAR